MEGRIRQLEHLLENVRDHRGRPTTASSPPGPIVTIVYEGDADPTWPSATSIGHMEEKTGDLDVDEPGLPARRGAARRRRRRRRSSTRRRTARCASRSSRSSRRRLTSSRRRARPRRSSRRPTCPRAAASSCPGAAPRSPAHISGPTGAPVVLLLHGWTANADLNWFTCYRAAGRALPRRRHRPPRSRPRHPQPQDVPPRGLRRRRRRAVRVLGIDA